MAFNIDKKYIKETEEELNATLPESYKKIMQENNGGCVIMDEDCWELFPIFDKSTRKRLSRTANHIIVENKRNVKRARFQDNILGIGSNACGDLLILKKKINKYLDAIYSWNHETGDIKQVANSFSELEIEQKGRVITIYNLTNFNANEKEMFNNYLKSTLDDCTSTILADFDGVSDTIHYPCQDVKILCNNKQINPWVHELFMAIVQERNPEL